MSLATLFLECRATHARGESKPTNQRLYMGQNHTAENQLDLGAIWRSHSGGKNESRPSTALLPTHDLENRSCRGVDVVV
jgi:hypothetical protein